MTLKRINRKHIVTINDEQVILIICIRLLSLFINRKRCAEMGEIKRIRKYTFTFKRFFKVKEFEIRAFSLKSAVEKFNIMFPKHRIISIDEVEE